MLETPEDVQLLQDLLDQSYANAGLHLREVITSDRRLDAAELCTRMKGVRLLTVATVTSDHRPIAGPAMASSIEVLSTLAHRLNPSGSSTLGSSLG